jgi:hypothetical protein
MDFLELLVPYPADQMRMWEISPRVNSPTNDDPSLWELSMQSQPMRFDPEKRASQAQDA